MFDKISDRLTSHVRNLPRGTWRENRTHLYFAAAYGVLLEYLEKDFLDLNAMDPFISQSYSSTSELKSFGFYTRVMQIGEAVFLMRACTGFGEMCRRLKSRDLRSAFFETLAAKTMCDAGFDIHMRPETGRKKEDFDFTAVRNDKSINVEVTALTAEAFSEETVANALKHKRQQLPTTAPAIIVCVIPENWSRVGIGVQDHVMPLVERFLDEKRGTRAVNAVLLLQELHLGLGSAGAGGIYQLLKNVVFNRAPRIPFADLDFLTAKRAGRFDARTLFQQPDYFSEHPDALDATVKEYHTSEFFQWVDSLVPWPARHRGAWLSSSARHR